MQYFTGSQDHNVVLRGRAEKRGLRLNEYGLFRTADNVRAAGAEEEEIYNALGLAWIPPELREARGEIEAAAARTLPRLVDRADLRIHAHQFFKELLRSERRTIGRYDSRMTGVDRDAVGDSPE